MSNNKTVVHSSSFSAGGLIGVALAAYLSHQLGNSIVWVAIHALFGWLYVLYLCGGCGGGMPPGAF